MRFAYQTLPTLRPVYPLGGIRVRHLPACAVVVSGPLGDGLVNCRLDSGADDTIFPEATAQQLGIDLTNAPWGESSPVAGSPARYRYATITLRSNDGPAHCEWKAIVGFINLPNMRWGFAGLSLLCAPCSCRKSLWS